MKKATAFMTTTGHFRTEFEFELATRSWKRASAATTTIFLWASLIDLEFAASLVLPIQAFDGSVPFCDIAHRNETKTARFPGFAIRDQFDFSNRAERLKEFPQRAFCHVKGKITDVELHDDWIFRSIVSYRAVPA